MKIQLLSDLHLEFKKNKFPDIEDCDLLILAGDIGYPHEDRYKKFLKVCNDTVMTILITGNHEYYYSRGYKIIDEMIQEIVKELPNVHFLQKNFVDIDDIRIIGCTLWSHIPDESSVTTVMNDFEKIQDHVCIDGRWRKIKIGSHHVNEWHENHKDILSTIIENTIDKKIIVVTHHTPMLPYRDGPLKHGFHSDQEELLLSGKIMLWCHGHTHFPHTTKIHDTVVWCNPHGYPGERSDYSNETVCIEDGELYY